MVIAVVLLIIIIVVVICILFGNALFNSVLRPKKNKSGIMESLGSVLVEAQIKKDAWIEEGLLWMSAAGTEDVFIDAKDGLKLHGYFIKNNSHKWVIMGHGYTGDATELASAAMKFYKMGYNVIMPDARGHGKSDGTYIGLGWHERLDYLEWIQKATAWDGKAEIVLYGTSMGGATVMMTAGEALPQNVKAVIEDCGYTSVYDMAIHMQEKIFKSKSSLGKVLIWFTDKVVRIRAKYSIYNANALEQVKKCKIPIMLIHGADDNFVPTWMAERLYEAVNCEKELYIVEGAGHLQAARIAGDEYWRRIGEFIGCFINA